MALLDFLKRKDENEKAKQAKKPAAAKISKETKPEQKTGEVKVQKKEVQKTQTAQSKTSTSKSKNSKAFSFEAIKEPHISEKGTILAESNQYVFKVSPNFNKTEIKKSVEGIYGVDVLSVNLIKIPAKKRRIGRNEGFKKQYKKAVVKIAEGQKIEIL